MPNHFRLEVLAPLEADVFNETGIRGWQAVADLMDRIVHECPTCLISVTDTTAGPVNYFAFDQGQCVKNYELSTYHLDNWCAAVETAVAKSSMSSGVTGIIQPHGS